MSEFT